MPSVVSLGPEVQVNSAIAGIQGTVGESRQAVASDAAGNFVVVWASQGQDGDGWGVYGQRFTALGVSQGSEFRVNTTTAGDQFFPAVDMDDTGDFVVVWSGAGPGDTDGIFSQRYDAAGTAQGDETRVNATTAGSQQHASVALADSGNFVVVWSGNGPDDAGGIFGQRYAQNGNSLGSEFRVNTTASGAQDFASVTIDNPGNFIVTWSSFGQDGDGWGVFGRRFNASGTGQGTEFQVSTSTVGDQWLSSAARDSGGDFIITWTGDSDPAAGVDWDIFARRYNTQGEPLGDVLLVNSATQGDQFAAAVELDEQGNFVVTWTGRDQSGGTDIFARRYLGEGLLPTGEFQVNTTTVGEQHYSSLAMTDNGNFVVVWSGNGPADDAGVLAASFILAPGITVVPVSALLTSEGGGSASFQVVLDTQPAAPVTIGLSSSDTTEGTVAPLVLTFDQFNWNTPQTVTVTGVDDLQADGMIAFTVITAPAVSDDPDYSGMEAADVAVTNLDDEAGILISPTAGLATTEGGGTASFSVSLLSPPLLPVTIGLHSSDPSEGTLSASSLVFTSANWAVAQIVTVSGVNDLSADGDLGYLIVTSPAVSFDGRYSGLDAVDVAVTNLDDDTAGLTVSPDGPLALAEGGAGTPLSLALTSQPTAAVVVSFQPGSQLAVSAASLTFTPDNWATPQTLTVSAVDDDAAEGAHAATLQFALASDDSHYDGLAVGGLAAAIADDDSAGVVLAPVGGPLQLAEGGGGSYTVALTSRPTAEVVIAVVPDSRLGVVPANLTFTPDNWSTPQTVMVTAVNDAVAQGPSTEALHHTVGSPDPHYHDMLVGDLWVAVTDNDAAGIAVSPVSGLTTTETGGTAQFSVVLTSQPTADVLIGLSSSNTAEGLVAPEFLVFTAADWDVPQTVAVTGVDDFVADGDIGYQIVTAAALSDDPNYQGRDPADIALTNADNETPGITVTPTSGLTTSELGGQATFSVVLHTQPSANVLIPVNSSVPLEGVADATSLLFTDSNWSVPQTVTITGVNDLVDDGNQSYSIILGAASSADLAYDGMDVADVAVTNLDNDTAGVLLAPGGLLTLGEDAPGTQLSVALTSQPTAVVVLTVNPGDQLGVSSAILTFTPDDWHLAQTVTVSALDDSAAEGDHAATLRFALTSSDSGYDGLAVGGLAVSIADNDHAGVVLSPVGGPLQLAEGGSGSYTVVLTSQPAGDVVVTVVPDSRLGVVLVSLTFTSDNWATPQTVIVTAVDDAVAQGPSTEAIHHTVSSLDPLYHHVTVSDLAVSIVDNDAAGILVSSVGLPTSEAGGTAEFTVVLTSQPAASVLVGLSSSNTAEGLVAPGFLVFTMADWNVPQTVAVTGVDDFVADGDISYQIVTAAALSDDPNYQGRDPADVALTNHDDDTAGLILAWFSPSSALFRDQTVTLSLVLRSQPTGSVVIPLLVPAGNLTVSVPSLVFTSANWSVPQSFSIRAEAVEPTDGPTASTLQAGPTISLDPGYTGLSSSALILLAGSNTVSAAPSAAEVHEDLVSISTVLRSDATPQPAIVWTDEPAGRAAPTMTATSDAQLPDAAGKKRPSSGREPIGASAEDEASNVPFLEAKSGPADQVLPDAQVPTTPPAARPRLDTDSSAYSPSSPAVDSATGLLEDAEFWGQLDRLSEDFETHARGTRLEAQVVGGLTIGVMLYVGYWLLTSRAALWLLLGFAVRPVWRPFDVLEVIFAWEQEKERRRGSRAPATEDESLQSITEGASEITSSPE